MEMDTSGKESDGWGDVDVIEGDAAHKRVNNKENYEFYRKLFETMAQGVVYQDRHGAIILANKAAEEILGLSMEEMRGLKSIDPHWRSIHEDGSDFPGSEHPAMLALKTGEVVKDVIMGVHNPKENSYRWILVSAVPEFKPKRKKPFRVYATFTDITEIKAAREALTESEKKYRQLVEELEQRVLIRTAEMQDLYDHAPNGYHSLDKNGIIIMINQTELDWLGYSQEELVGKKKIFELFTPQSQKNFQRNFPTFMSQGWIKDLEFDIIRKDGSILPVLLNGTAIYDADGNYMMSRSTIFDITRRKQAEEALRRSEADLRESRDALNLANVFLEKAARLKDEFLASMSHELRTPLTGILGLSEALLLNTYGTLTEKQLIAVKNIKNSGQHLLELINDILDLSKIEAGKMDMQFEVCSLAVICRSSMQLAKGMAQHKNQSISFSMEPESIGVMADPRRLKQMLINLLSNAIKFTPEYGSLGLQVKKLECENVVRLTVWDKGIGIKEEDLSRLFQPFVQLDSSLSRQQSGTGLGLSLVKRMVELHQGRLEVESEVGIGSRFSLVLPSLDAEMSEVNIIEAEESGGHVRRFLTVEDNPLDMEYITRYLSEMGIKNLIVPKGENVVDLAIRIKPDAILLDLNLPDRPGFEILTELKANPLTRSIPVIISSISEERETAVTLGASGYLVKPFSILELRSELFRLSMHSLVNESLIWMAPDAPLPLVLIVEDNEITRTTISDYLKTKNFNIVAAEGGLQAINLLASVHPDIILMDIQMPGMDGLETIRRIRGFTNPLISNVPIIAVTALAMVGDQEQCLSAGANDYLSKPVQLTGLVNRIKQNLSKRNLETTLNKEK